MNDVKTLVAVFDSSNARFFEFKTDAQLHGHLLPTLQNVKSELKHDLRDIEADRPGRGFSPGGAHHAHESEHDPRKLHKGDFVRAVAGVIDRALVQNQFGRVVVVAPHRSIGEFRAVASDKVSKAIWQEVAKDFANLTDSELAKHLLPLLKPE